MRSGYLTALAASAVIAMTVPAQAQARVYDVAPGDLRSALDSYARQSGKQIIYRVDDLRGVRTRGVKGAYAPDKALRALLSGTGFSPKTDRTGAIAIIRGRRLSAVQAPALAAQGQGGSAPVDTVGNDEEIVVTAQKREERLQDIPQSVSAISADTLASQGITQLRDFAAAVPGLNIATTGAGYTQITLRGVTSGVDVGQTVGIYVDDVPFGSSAVFGGASRNTLDMGLFDVDRIEVLRGPQGTLYGASALGGVLRYVTKKPDVSGFGVDVRAGLSQTRHGGANYEGSVSVNVPIADTAAIRASGFYSRDGGYTDNVASGEADINAADIYGGRIDLLLSPTDRLTVRLTGFAQNIRRDGEGTVDYQFSGRPIYGALDQFRLFREFYNQNFRVISGALNYRFDGAELISISSYQHTRIDLVSDLSPLYVPLFGGGYGGIAADSNVEMKKFAQEVRLSSVGARPLEWQVGGFYTYEDSYFAQPLLLLDPAGNPTPNTLLTLVSPSTFKEIAAFGNLTWNATDRLSLSGGLRYAHNRQVYSQQGSGLFGQSSPPISSGEQVVTWMGNVRYRFSGRVMAYARVATGYRPGGPNIVAVNPGTGQPFQPATFESDSLTSYEIGIKGETADRSFGVEAAGYYIDWSDMHISVADNGGFSAIGNARGGASIWGSELNLIARPIRGLSVTGAFVYQRARLNEDEPKLGGVKGERLPNVPRFTASVSGDYILLDDDLRPSMGASLRYVDKRKASYDGAGIYAQYVLPSYVSVDLRAGLTIAKFQVQAHVRNLLDTRAQISAENWRGTAMPAISQPRTIGVSVRTQL
jgi:outer membrane receptor protein involved in Fe transport